MRWPLRPSRETGVAIGSGGGRPHGRLRISAPLLFSQMAMGGPAASYAARYPEVAVEVMGEDRLVDMVEGYDLAIRVNLPADESLIGRSSTIDWWPWRSRAGARGQGGCRSGRRPAR